MFTQSDSVVWRLIHGGMPNQIRIINFCNYKRYHRQHGTSNSDGSKYSEIRAPARNLKLIKPKQFVPMKPKLSKRWEKIGKKPQKFHDAEVCVHKRVEEPPKMWAKKFFMHNFNIKKVFFSFFSSLLAKFSLFSLLLALCVLALSEGALFITFSLCSL